MSPFDPFHLIHLAPLDIDLTAPLSTLSATQLALGCLLNSPGEWSVNATRAFRLLREKNRAYSGPIGIFCERDIVPGVNLAGNVGGGIAGEEFRRLESIGFDFFEIGMGVEGVRGLSSAQLLILASKFHPAACQDDRLANAASNEFFLRREVDIAAQIRLPVRSENFAPPTFSIRPKALALDLSTIPKSSFQEMSGNRGPSRGSQHRPAAAEWFSDHNGRVEQAIDDLLAPLSIPTPNSTFDSPGSRDDFFQPRELERGMRRPSVQETVDFGGISMERHREDRETERRNSRRRESVSSSSSRRRSPPPDSRGFYSESNHLDRGTYAREEYGRSDYPISNDGYRAGYLVKDRFEEVRPTRDGERERERSYSNSSSNYPRSPPSQQSSRRRHRSPSPVRSRMIRSRSRSDSPPRNRQAGGLNFRERYAGSNFLSSIPLVDQVPSSVVVSWSQLFLSNLPEFVTVAEIHSFFKDDSGLVGISQGSRKAIHSNSACWIAFTTEATRDACLRKWTDRAFSPKIEVMFIVKGESGKRRREWPLTGWIGPAAPCGLRPLPRSDENIGFRSDALESKIVEELVIKK